MSIQKLLPILVLSATATGCQSTAEQANPTDTKVIGSASTNVEYDQTKIGSGSGNIGSGAVNIGSGAVNIGSGAVNIGSGAVNTKLVESKLLDPYLDYPKTDETEDTGEYYIGVSLYSDSSGTLSTGETVTLTVDPGSVEAYAVEWYLGDSETFDQGGSVQQARWNEPGTYTVEAEVQFDDGSALYISETFTVLDLTLDIGFALCDGGGVGAELALSGTHADGQYAIYGSEDLATWTPLDIEIDGADEVTFWNSCDQDDRPNAQFFQAVVNDNPDGDEWFTGEELWETGTNPWEYEEGLSCLLVEEDGSWENFRTSAEVCDEYGGAMSSLVLEDPEVDTTEEAYTLQTRGIRVPDGWAADAAANGTASTGLGGTNPFVPNTHDCDDFAKEFEDAIEADGHDATITIIWTFDKKTCTKPIGGHAVNDFHDSDGRIGFWEPQHNVQINLDLNGDGKATIAPQGKGLLRPTEQGSGLCISIETFDDFEDANSIYHALMDP
jgi:hypothetical protein